MLRRSIVCLLFGTTIITLLFFPSSPSSQTLVGDYGRNLMRKAHTSAILGTSAWFTWSLHEVKTGDNVLLANVTVRAKYFYLVTLILNIICTGVFAASFRCHFSDEFFRRYFL